MEAEKSTPANSRFVSTIDPEASVTRHSGGKPKLRYKTHRGVDPKHEIITSTKITAGSRDDGDLLEDMVHIHDQKIKEHIPFIGDSHRDSGRRNGMFPKESFTYDPNTDRFTCPAGQFLTKRYNSISPSWLYAGH